MRTTLFVTVLTLLAAPAFAGEGNGEPFPLIMPPLSTTVFTGTAASGRNPSTYYAAPTTSNMTMGTAGAAQNPSPYAVAGAARAYDPATATPDQSAAAAKRTRVSTR